MLNCFCYKFITKGMKQMAPRWLGGNNRHANAGDARDVGSIPWVGKVP